MRSKVIDVALLLCVLVAGVLGGHAMTHTPKPQHVDSVSSYNDGWSESKQDDCEQGSAFACKWIAGNAPECTSEDGSTQPVCVWDADKHGNGVGHNVLNMSYGKESHNV